MHNKSIERTRLARQGREAVPLISSLCVKIMNKYPKFLILSILLIIPACSNEGNLPKESNLRKFDSVSWLSESSTNPDNNSISEREKMLKDLVENVLPGKTKDEIEKILGKSLETTYFASMDKDLIYYMGPERGSFINIDSEWLLIWLDESGRYKKYKLMND